MGTINILHNTEITVQREIDDVDELFRCCSFAGWLLLGENIKPLNTLMKWNLKNAVNDK